MPQNFEGKRQLLAWFLFHLLAVSIYFIFKCNALVKCMPYGILDALSLSLLCWSLEKTTSTRNKMTKTSNKWMVRKLNFCQTWNCFHFFRPKYASFSISIPMMIRRVISMFIFLSVDFLWCASKLNLHTNSQWWDGV